MSRGKSRDAENFLSQGDRLREAREGLGFSSQADFGAALGGFSIGQISRAERGENPVPPELLTALVDKFGVDVNYILTGAGSWRRSGEVPAPSPPTEPSNPTLEPAQRRPEKRLIIPGEDLAGLRPEIAKDFIPLLGREAAGELSYADDAGYPPGGANEYIHAPGAPKGSIALRVYGASMEPDYPDQSVLLVPGPISPPHIETPAVVFRKDATGEVGHSFKLARLAGKVLHLRPLNPIYKEEDVPLAQVIRILGVLARLI